MQGRQSMLLPHMAAHCCNCTCVMFLRCMHSLLWGGGLSTNFKGSYLGQPCKTRLVLNFLLLNWIVNWFMRWDLHLFCWIWTGFGFISNKTDQWQVPACGHSWKRYRNRIHIEQDHIIVACCQCTGASIHHCDEFREVGRVSQILVLALQRCLMEL